MKEKIVNELAGKLVQNVRLWIVVIMTVAPISPSYASAAADLSNHTTGPNSDNTNSVEIEQSIDASVSNNADVSNNIKINANTGGNTVRNNTTVGNVGTGNIDYDIQANNKLNTSLGKIELPSLPNLGSYDSTNHLTGPGSSNENSVKITNNRSLHYSNNANSTTNIDIKTSTGGNMISGNTKVGNITTGSIEGTIRIDNDLNNGGVGGNPDGNGGGTIVITPGGGGTPVIVAAEQMKKIAAANGKDGNDGKGGGYFPAGSDAYIPLLLAMMLVVLVANEKFTHRLSQIRLTLGRYSREA